jgi:hypothetical protein
MSDSRIITLKHIELISKWIDRLEITDEIKNPYEFTLILRGSRDGFSPSKFHKVCDNRSHTITVFKLKDSDEILGGYNPIIWKSDNDNASSKDSFIFSFKNKHNVENFILSRVEDERNAIYNGSDYGPSFGCGDLFVRGNSRYNKSYCYNSCYKESIRETDDYFSVEEYEIFQIMKIH